jgi:hypothetical protein
MTVTTAPFEFIQRRVDKLIEELNQQRTQAGLPPIALSSETPPATGTLMRQLFSELRNALHIHNRNVVKELKTTNQLLRELIAKLP